VKTFYLQWRGVRLRIREGDTVIGRGSDCELHIDDPTASRRHTLLHREGERITVTDLGSRNGTFVDADRIDGAFLLRGGERLLVGETSFDVLVVPSIEGLPRSDLSLGVGGAVEPVLGVPAVGAAPFAREHDATAPHLGTIEVLESLLASPHVADEAPALAAMVQNSLERLLGTVERRGDVLDDEAKARLRSVLREVEGWFADGAFGSVAATLRRRLG
jgi:hypothetical protein